MNDGQRISVDDLKGRSVIDDRGVTIGEVKDVAFDPLGWRVTGLLVDVRKEVADDLHLDRSLLGGTTLEFGTERIRSVGDNVLLNLDTDDMAGALRRGG